MLHCHYTLYHTHPQIITLTHVQFVVYTLHVLNVHRAFCTCDVDNSIARGHRAVVRILSVYHVINKSVVSLSSQHLPGFTHILPAPIVSGDMVPSQNSNTPLSSSTRL